MSAHGDDDIGNTALHVAIQTGDTTTAMRLIDAGADVNAKNKFGETPMHYAAFFTRVEIIKRLLEHDADVDAQTNSSRETDPRSLDAKLNEDLRKSESQ